MMDIPDAGAQATDFNPETLHQFALFSRLASDERALLAKCMRRRTFREGTALTKQGASATKFYCVLAGTVDVHVRYPGADKEEKVAQLGEGTTVGDFALAEITECTASTFAATETYTLEGDIQAMIVLFDRHPELGKKVYKALAKALVSRVQEMNKNLFYLL